MVHRVFYIAAAAAFVAGCGQSAPPTPAQLVSMGRFDEAIEVCTQSVRANPRDAEAFLYRGRAFHCRNQPGDLPRAIADFTEAIGLAPEDSEAYYSRALAYRDQGKAEESAADQREARRFDPRLAETYAQISKAASVSASPDATEPDAKDADQPDADQEEADKSQEEASPLIRSERRRERQKARPASPGTEFSTSDLPQAPPTAKSRRDELLDSLRGGQQAPLLLDEDPWGDGPAVTKSPSDKAGPDARPRSGQRSGETGQRAPAASSEPRRPASPWQPRAYPSAAPGAEQPAFPSPYGTRSLSPFPQRAPRPTGIVEDRAPGPARSQPRTLYSNPYSVPTVQPPVARQDDLNP